ncbi:serine/threonine protein phosphatase [Euryarchaeota archaeon]|nr:serine/threonine protein phosphatase [Euryarchaeota archaeon]
MRDFELEKNLQSTINNDNSVWVIGDIHGYNETFDALIKKLCLSEQDIILCLGDLIDKGPNSLKVLETVKESSQIFSIRGNHEEMMRLSISPEHGRMMKSWLKYGGLITLESFSNDEKERIKEARKWLPFIENLPTEIVLEKYRIVHAGYDDSKPIDEQNNQQKMWGRTIFQIEKSLDNNRQIIVGHTPVQTLNRLGKEQIWASEINLVDGRSSVLCIDTGVFLETKLYPRLTALNLTDGQTISQERVENYWFNSPSS